MVVDFLELVLKYSSPLVLTGASVAFCFGLFKWLAEYRRENERHDREVFFEMIQLASGKNNSGEQVSMNKQIAAIYHLQNYPQYAFAAIPILDLAKSDFNANAELEPRAPYIFEAIEKTSNSLKSVKTSRWKRITDRQTG